MINEMKIGWPGPLRAAFIPPVLSPGILSLLDGQWASVYSLARGVSGTVDLWRNYLFIYLFFLSNIKSYRDKVLKHYDLLDYNTKTEPGGGAKYHDYPPGIERIPKYNWQYKTTYEYSIAFHIWRHG